MPKKNRVALLLPLSLCGCMQYLIEPPAPSKAGGEHRARVDSYLGSEVQKPAVYLLARECRGGEQLARVEVRRNFAQGLISWLTLNLYSPATVTYICANAGEPGEGDTGNPPGGSR